jgi:hypothetical protein
LYFAKVSINQTDMLTFIFALWLSVFQVDSTASAKLQRLIQERDQLHSQWKASESKKTGIFGNRTKKDMIETNDWLERILLKDNQIMDELRMQGSIEKVTISQEKEDYKSITMKLERDVQILKRALSEKEAEVEKKISDRRTFEWTTLIFFLSTAFLAWWVYRSKRASF